MFYLEKNDNERQTSVLEDADQVMILLLSFLIGAVAGLRALTAPAAAALAARLGWVSVASTPLAFMGYRWTVWIFGLLALIELVTDQLSNTPSRKVPMQFATRLLTGALAGATIGAGAHTLVLGAVLGFVGAVAGTLGGAELRRALAARFGRDLPAALIEDVVAVGGALLLAAAA